MSNRATAALVAVGFGLLLVAWAFSTKPFAAPDEAQHYLRAANLEAGHLLGPKVPVFAATPQQTAFIEHDTRGVPVSAAMAPPGLPCVDGGPVPRRGTCLVASYEGNFEPLPYLLPAVAIAISNTAHRALWLGRLASVLPTLLFLVLAFLLLWEESLWSVIGLFAAVTPETLFIGSVINPNGLELAADLAFLAGLLRITRRPHTTSAWIWTATITSGAATILAWQLGWVFVAAQLLVAGALLGIAQSRALLRSETRRLVAGGAILLAALAVYFAYGLRADLLHGDFGIQPFGPSLHAGLVQLRTNLFGAVGLFGLLDVSLPGEHYYWIWFVLVLALLARGGALADARGRRALALGTVLALAFPVLFYAWVQRHSGFGLQPRHVMPLLALIPMLAGELSFRSRDRWVASTARWLPAVAIGVTACFQLFAWWINARSSAGRPGSFWFIGSPLWTPPGGWLLWTLTATAGAAVLVGWAVSYALLRSPARARAGAP